MSASSTAVKALFLTLGLMLVLGMAAPLAAQQCESLLDNRRVSLVLPYSAGGGFDAYARVFAPVFESLTGASVRIRHLPGAGSMLGINAVANAGPRDMILGLFNPIVLYNEMIFERDGPEMSDFAMLGSLYADRTVWATRTDYDVAFDSDETRLFALASNSDFIRVLLPGFALGWNIRIVRGYSGTSDSLFALLRGDIDFIYSSSVSLASFVQSSDGLTPYLAINEGPNSVFPDTPYLIGQEGILEQMINGLPEEQQQERMAIARLASELAKTYRAITVSSTADPTLLDCLATMVEATLFSTELQELAVGQNLVIEPEGADSLQSAIAETGRLIDGNWTLIQRLVEVSRD